MSPRSGARRGEELSAWMDGELRSARARELEAELARDPAVRARVESFSRVSRALAVSVEPDPGFLVRHRARRAAVSVVPRWTWRQLTFRLALATAGCLLAAGLAVLQGSAGDGAPLPVGIADANPLAVLEGELLAPFAAELGGRFPDAGSGEDPEPVLLIAVGAGLPLPADPGR